MNQKEKKTAETNKGTKNQTYRIIRSGLKSKKEALQGVVYAKQKGYLPQIIIEDSEYKLHYAESQEKSEEEKILKAVKESGLAAEICGLER